MVGVDVSWSGFRRAGSRRSLGFRPMANSMVVLPLKVMWVFLSVAALRINWAGVICARMVWSRFVEAVCPRGPRNFSGTVVHPFLLESAMVFLVLLEFPSRCAFGRMPACREDGGKPYLHKLPSDSSGTYPSIHEVLKLLLMEKYSCMGRLSNKM